MTKKSSRNNAQFRPLPEFKPVDTSEFVDLYNLRLGDYCRNLLTTFGRLENQGMALDDEEGDSGPIHIDSLYVLPNASKQRLPPEMLAEQEKEGEEDVNLAWRPRGWQNHLDPMAGVFVLPLE
ncbi:MAG: hypothetical protein ACI9FJ_000725 [Alteromonadaceae bacterium]|jgi:hypothetical protein